jgi:hypothetical protein
MRMFDFRVTVRGNAAHLLTDFAGAYGAATPDISGFAVL